MLDLKLIRSEPDRVRGALARRGDAALLDPVLELDRERRQVQAQVDEVRARRNALSETVARSKRARDDPAAATRAEAAIREMGEVKTSLGALEERLRDLDASLQRALLEIPNLPDPSAPPGDREEDAALVRVVGDRPAFTFAPRDHMELAGRLIDVERASRTSGSRFGYLLGDVAMLWLALSRFAIDTLRAKGFELVIPPVMVREQAMWDTGFFPTDQQAVYGLPSDDLFLVGTSEVPLAAFHAGETLQAGDLPLRYCGLSACFRREAGAAGRDTRGIFRTHQFEKVEMFSFCDPARSGEEHEYLLSIEEEIARALGLHYRIVNIAAGDLGGSAAKKYDIEVWLPGQGQYRELTSCSNCTDYQARRLGTRVRADGGLTPVHTLNGTAATSSRSVIAVLETHQQEDGSVVLPQVLVDRGAAARLAASDGLSSA
jgi:seryl-tRNA synthetase